MYIAVIMVNLVYVVSLELSRAAAVLFRVSIVSVRITRGESHGLGGGQTA